MSKHVYGYRPDLPDFRDHYVANGSAFLAAMPDTLPATQDLSAQFSAIETQVRIGSCTAQAIVGVLEFLLIKLGLTYDELSRLFVYWNERNYEGTVNQDAGAFIRDGIKVAAALGVCRETLWPYDEDRYKERPPHAAFVDATRRRITEYARVPQDISSMRTVLASGYPIIVGISIYDSFESDAVTRTGIVPMPDASEQLLGGHAVVITGYDQQKKRFKLRNSWGPDWGDSGYFWLPYEYLENPNLASDLWVIRH